jgi:hypothetical protein
MAPQERHMAWKKQQGQKQQTQAVMIIQAQMGRMTKTMITNSIAKPALCERKITK